MPSIQTLVADLDNGSVTGIGLKPDSNQTNIAKTISDTCRVKYKFVHMKASISGTNRLSCQSARDSVNFDGSYIHFQDAWSTVGNMDINRTIVASGNFSGCAYKIYRSAPGAFKCVHIARPGGTGADALVVLMDNYARQVGWTLIRSVSTAGLIGGVNQDFHFGPGTVTVYTRAAPNTTSFRAEPCTSPPAAGPKARPSAHRR